MSRRDQLDDFMVGGSRGPSAYRPDPNAGRRPGDPYIIAQDSRPVGKEGLTAREREQYDDFLKTSDFGYRGGRTPLTGDPRTALRNISKLDRMAFDQFRNLQRGGDYAPALRPGMRVPGGTVQRRETRNRGGLADFFGRGGFLGSIGEAIGGTAPKRIVRNVPDPRMTPSSYMAPQMRDRILPFQRGITALPIEAEDSPPVSLSVNEKLDLFPETGMDTPFLPQESDISKTEVNEILQEPDAVEIALQAANAVARPLAAREIAQAQSQAAADQTDLAEINMLERGRELVDGANQANTLIAQAIADEQARQIRQANLDNTRELVNEAARSAPLPGPMDISLDGYGRPIMDYMSPTEEAYMRMTEADDVGGYMDPSAQTSEQQLRPYDRGGVPGTGEGITMRPSDVLGAVSGMAPPSSYGVYREFNLEGMPYVSRRSLNTREDLGRMMDEMLNRRLGNAPNISQGI